MFQAIINFFQKIFKRNKNKRTIFEHFIYAFFKKQYNISINTKYLTYEDYYEVHQHCFSTENVRRYWIQIQISFWVKEILNFINSHKKNDRLIKSITDMSLHPNLDGIINYNIRYYIHQDPIFFMTRLIGTYGDEFLSKSEKMQIHLQWMKYARKRGEILQ